MVTNAELESQFKAISQDYEGTKKTLDQLLEKVESMDEKLNSVDSKLKELRTMPKPIIGEAHDANKSALKST
ncbi:hypothetical protein CMV_024000 [Castanea mollissima]|uniref:Uncharacterized protein n=1 Tax=Castanea mollissima TaxID=60419 RepID=A0A8J4VCX8_9ROSI|nr:hypothetical protein CMV_024000 [Castanea mollissima]